MYLLPFFHLIDGADAGFDPEDHTEVDSRWVNGKTYRPSQRSMSWWRTLSSITHPGFTSVALESGDKRAAQSASLL